MSSIQIPASELKTEADATCGLRIRSHRGHPMTRALILPAALAAVLSLLSLTPGSHDLAAALTIVVPVALVVGWWTR